MGNLGQGRIKFGMNLQLDLSFWGLTEGRWSDYDVGMGHDWEYIGLVYYICRECKIYGRAGVGVKAYNSSLSCQEIREKLKDHQFNKDWCCKECGLEMIRHEFGEHLYYWPQEILDCDEAIIKGIIE
jgi:hypothetical protein